LIGQKQPGQAEHQQRPKPPGQAEGQGQQPSITGHVAQFAVANFRQHRIHRLRRADPRDI